MFVNKAEGVPEETLFTYTAVIAPPQTPYDKPACCAAVPPGSPT